MFKVINNYQNKLADGSWGDVESVISKRIKIH